MFGRCGTGYATSVVLLSALACTPGPYVASAPLNAVVDRDTGWRVEAEPLKVTTTGQVSPPPPDATPDAVVAEPDGAAVVAADQLGTRTPPPSQAAEDVASAPADARAGSESTAPSAAFAVSEPQSPETPLPPQTTKTQAVPTDRPVVPTQPPREPPRESSWNVALEEPPPDDPPQGATTRVIEDSIRVGFSTGVTAGGIWGSDFEGRTFLAGANGVDVDMVLVPKLARGAGVHVGGYLSGTRIASVSLWTGFEYEHSWLTASFAGLELGNASLQEFNVPLRFSAPVNDALSIYVDIGVALTTLTVDDAAATVDSNGNLLGNPREATLQGFSLAFALGGVFFVVRDRFGFDARVACRAHTFGIVDDVEIQEGLDAGGYDVRLGPALYF